MKVANEKIRILIVDDSPFSRRLVSDSLDPYWFEIVGFADGFRSALEIYRTDMPDVITLDISGSEMDVLEVSRRIVGQEPEAKIVILSNSQEVDLEARARANGAAAVLSKPSDPDTLMNTLRTVCEADLVDDVFNNHYPDEFISALTKLISRFTDDFAVNKIPTDPRINSSGISVVIGITGAYSGRMVVDLSAETAKTFAFRLLKQEPKNMEQINEVMTDFTEIVAKNATVRLNKEFRGAFLRTSPPAVFTGEKFSIGSPSLDVHAWGIDTPFGHIRFSAGFKREVV